MRLVVVIAAFLIFPATAAAQGVDAAATALRTNPVYVDPEAELADQVDAAALRGQIGESAVFVAVLPESAVEGSPGRTLIALREAVGEEGRYALVVGDELRTLPSEPGQDATPDDVQAALTQFVEEAPSGSSGGGGGGGGGAIAAIFALLVLVALLVGGSLLLVNRRRARARDGRSTVGEIDVTDDFVRLGDGIRALEIDVTLGEQGRADYDRAVAAYGRANDLQRRGDDAGANRALDEGLAAIAAARERIAGR